MIHVFLALLCSTLEPPTDSTTSEDASASSPATTSPASDEPSPTTTAIEDPSTVVAESEASAGGFGVVESVTTSSNVQAPPPPTPSDPEGPPGPEMSALVQVGYAQTDVGNLDGLDHHGLLLRAHFVYYPWISRSRTIAGGLGALYSYHGLNRWKLPADTPASKAQQQLIMISADMLIRPHPQWFSMLVSGGIGLGFYSNAKLFAADRQALIAKDEYAFVAGGSLGLCTAWGIVCVVGGAQTLLEVRTLPRDPVLGEAVAIDPWGWQVALGFDVLRVMSRANRTAG